MSENDTKYIPTKIIPREAGYINHLKIFRGDIDYNKAWGNKFPEMEQIAEKIIPETEFAIQYKLIDVTKKQELLRQEYLDAIKKIKQMWWDGCFYGIKDDYKIFLFEQENGFDRLVKLPSLCNLIPRGSIGDGWGVHIRETMLICDAFAGHSYTEIITNAGFMFEKLNMPKFNAEELKHQRIQTEIIAEDVYNKIMSSYRRQFFGKYAPLVSTFHQELIDYIDGGGGIEFEFEERKEGMMAKLE